MTDFEEKFSRAVSHRDSGDYEKALEELLPLSRIKLDSATLFAVLGDIYWELGRLHNAAQSFRKAVVLAPTAEAVSLGLFHCLWELGELGDGEAHDMAIAEIRRFMSNSDSKEYREIIDALHEAMVENLPE